MESITIDQARSLAVLAQGFGRVNRDTKVSLAQLRTGLARMHVLQLDAIPIVVRTQYMPAFSRLGSYPCAMLDRLAYGRDEWFECWAHEASLLPVDHQPLMRWAYQRARRGEVWPAQRKIVTEQPELIREVRRQVRTLGPLRGADLVNPGPRHSHPGWSSRTSGAMVLSYLFRCGELGIRRSGNFEKEFDLIENIVPAAVLNQATPDEPEALRQLLTLAAQACGIGSADDLIDYFRLPVRVARPLLEELVEDGQLIACSVQGWTRTAYMAAHTDQTGTARVADIEALVSPFDPLVWYRERLSRLFDFDYRIEIYTPQKKRRWGYYVFPFLMGNRLVGRCDLKLDRAARVLRVPAAHIEAGCDPDEVADAMARELRRMAAWVDADRIVAGRRGQLIGALRSALKRPTN